MQILRDDTGPRAREVSALARRLIAIHWLTEPIGVAHRTAVATATAVGALRRASGLSGSAPLDIVGARDAALELGQGQANLVATRSWPALEKLRAEASAEILRRGIADDHPVFVRSGQALLVRPQSLPIDAVRLGAALGPCLADMAPEIRSLIVLAVQDQAAVCLAYESVADSLAPNPLLPIWTLYEEGLLPLELSERRTAIFCPWK